jgi:hypothetical protein
MGQIDVLAETKPTSTKREAGYGSAQVRSLKRKKRRSMRRPERSPWSQMERLPSRPTAHPLWSEL